MKNKLDIIYEDEYIVAVNKTAPLLSIPDRYDSDKPNLYQFLKDKYKEIFIVHRLDKETSGIICFAKTSEAHRALSLQFEQREIGKIYHAIVSGSVAKESGIIDSSIAQHSTVSGKMVVHKRGKASLSLYKVAERFKHYTLVEVDLKTGRTHQIRVHLASIGHPLMIDALYAHKEAFYLSEVKNKSYRLGKQQEERPLMTRLTLHAHQLTIEHPISKESLRLEASPPKDFRAVLQQLRKWGK